MKPVRTLLMVLAIAFAAPVVAQPGLDDPELTAWMESANAAQKARLEALDARGDVDSLLMAMSLVHPMFPLREDPEAEIAAEQARAWALLERAAQVDSQHPVVAWKLANCPADSGLPACGSPASRERLQAVGGSRAAVHLWLAQVAQATGDEAAFETHLQGAADATAYGAFDHEQSELIWTAWDGIEFPEADPDVARSYSRHVEIDSEAFVEQAVALSVTARIAASVLPNLALPLQLCGVSVEDADISAERRGQCLALFTTMGNENSSLLQRIVAEQAMLWLTTDAPEADRWKERLRTTAWVGESGVPLSVALSSRHDPEYFATWREEGEYRALLDLMERRGVETSPPDGWVPANEGIRELLDGR